MQMTRRSSFEAWLFSNFCCGDFWSISGLAGGDPATVCYGWSNGIPARLEHLMVGGGSDSVS
jgi:hypothetical protein